VKIKNNLYIKIGQTTKIWTCDFFVFFRSHFPALMGINALSKPVTNNGVYPCFELATKGVFRLGRCYIFRQGVSYRPKGTEQLVTPVIEIQFVMNS